MSLTYKDAKTHEIVADYFKIICIPWAFRKGIAKFSKVFITILSRYRSHPKVEGQISQNLL